MGFSLKCSRHISRRQEAELAYKPSRDRTSTTHFRVFVLATFAGTFLFADMDNS